MNAMLETPQVVVIDDTRLERLRGAQGRPSTPVTMRYRAMDDGDTLVLLDDDGDGAASTCSVALPEDLDEGSRATVAIDGGTYDVGLVVVPTQGDLHARLAGLFETDALAASRVLMVGVGSGGSGVLRELVRAGVGHFALVDHDRLEPGNICRHELGLSDVGRLKVNALRDYVADRNPAANVTTRSFHLSGETMPQLMELIDDFRPDLIVCGTDNRPSRLLCNRASVLTDTVALYGGARRRAYAGDVLRVIPRLTPCYQCYVMTLPEVALDREVASADAAAQVAYSDRPVAPQPGLSSDIAPLSLLMTKLALVELTAGRVTAFDSLRADLVAPKYFWLNRREPGTPYAQLPPLEDRLDGQSVLRWIGERLDRIEDCPVCGDAMPDRSSGDAMPSSQVSS